MVRAERVVRPAGFVYVASDAWCLPNTGIGLVEAGCDRPVWVADCSGFRCSTHRVPAAVLSRPRPWVAWRLFCSAKGVPEGR